MATIYLDTPTTAPDTVTISQAATLNDDRTTVIDAVAYGSFPISGNNLVVTNAGLDDSKYSFVIYTYSGVDSDELVIHPDGTLVVTMQTIFNNVLKRLSSDPPVQGFLTTAQQVISYIDKRLHEMKSDLIIYDNTATLAANKSEISLPQTMISVEELPLISYTGCTRAEIYPLPTKRRQTFTTTGVPRYYEIRRCFMTLYPTPDRSITIRYRTYNRTTVSALTDVVPYEGIFNDLIEELVVRFGSDPLSAVTPVIEAYVSAGLDRSVARRPRKNVRLKFPAY